MSVRSVTQRRRVAVESGTHYEGLAVVDSTVSRRFKGLCRNAGPLIPRHRPPLRQVRRHP